MAPKAAPVAKSNDGDAADHEKEFVEKELTISFLKTRLSRCEKGNLPISLRNGQEQQSHTQLYLQAPGAW